MRTLQALGIGFRALLFGALGFGLSYLIALLGFRAEPATALNFAWLGLAVCAVVGGLWGKHVASFLGQVLMSFFE